jgi:hypothetical protein
LLGQSPSPENAEFLPPWRVRLNVLSVATTTITSYFVEFPFHALE